MILPFLWFCPHWCLAPCIGHFLNWLFSGLLKETYSTVFARSKCYHWELERKDKCTRDSTVAIAPQQLSKDFRFPRPFTQQVWKRLVSNETHRPCTYKVYCRWRAVIWIKISRYPIQISFRLIVLINVLPVIDISSCTHSSTASPKNDSLEHQHLKLFAW